MSASPRIGRAPRVTDEPRKALPMKTLLDALTILIPCNTTMTNHAAGHLVAAQVVHEFPKPLLDARCEAL